jgi:dipeptidyl aminopeptidase/acylaminoacyl peptidase
MMKSILLNALLAASIIGSGGTVSAQGKGKKAKLQEEGITIAPVRDWRTPILDRELFFGNPEIAGGQLSPDGQWISFLKQYDGILNVWVKKFDEPFEAARPLTNSKRPLYGYFWSEDGKYILYAKDKDGDENINIFAVDPMAEAAEGGVPVSRNLTDREEVTAQIYNISQNNPDLMFIGLNDRDKAWHDLYSLKISSGELTLMYENSDRITGYTFDWDDQLRLLSRTDEKGNTVILRKDADGSLTPVYDFSVTEQAGIAGWNEDNSKVYLITNKGDLNLMSLFLMDPITLEKTFIESDPQGKVDFGGMTQDRNTRKIISTAYVDDKRRYNFHDKQREAVYQYLLEQLPGREISFQSATHDYKKFLIATSGDKYVSESWFFDVDTKQLIFQYTPRPKLKAVEEYLAPMTPLRYKSSDGLEIPAYLTVPVGMEAKNLPVVVLVHGGPKGPRDYWGYNSYAQFLANRGYAVLQPNFRASGGYGKAFLNAGDLQWGKLMQDDITWGVKHLIQEGIADAGKVVIMGGSYGGYATLAGLAFTPDVYAAGVDIVGPSNIFTLLESIPPYWEAGRAFLYGMVGDPNTEEGQQLIREASPLFSADKINKPLLIIQGANDPRVKQAEADQIVIALRDKGKQVSYLLAEDEGHGFSKPVNNMAMFAEIERFLAGILGGRFQESMPENVAKRLEELRVDISAVVYEPKEAVASATSLPVIKSTLKEGTFQFDVKIEIQGQSIPMSMTRTISKKGNNWSVKEEQKGAMGQAVDEMEYTATYQPVGRTVNQMGQNIGMSFSSDKVSINAMGQNIEVAMNGAYMADGPGMDMIIAGLPLAPGYELIFSTPDMMTMKAKQLKLSVTGQEEVNGVQCLIAEVSSMENAADKTVYYINPVLKMAEKTVQVLPAMGNAKLTVTKK